MTQFLQRTALIALASGALGACSSDEALRPNFPTRISETSPPAAAPAPAETPPPAPSETPSTAPAPASVDQHPLAPLAPARPPAEAAPLAQAKAPQAAPPAPALAPSPAYRSVTTRTVTGRVVEVEGRAVAYRVRKGDTLDDIADNLDTTVRQLREDNGLKKRAKIHPGQVLKGPRRRGHAYVAESGDTLYSIARRFNVTADALREENELSRTAGLHPGEKIRLPQGYHDRGPLVSTNRVLVASSAAPPASSADAPAPEPEDQPGPAPREAAPAVAAPSAAPAYRTVTTRTVTGRLVEVEGRPASYKVRKGDNLAKVARKLDTTVQQLREDNDLGRHEAIHPGDVLKGPSPRAHAYVAESGDTLYSIARRFGVSAEALRDENGLGRNPGLHPGEKIRLPQGYHDHGPLTSTIRVLVAAPPPAPPPRQEASEPPPPAAPRPAPASAPPVRSYSPAPPPWTYAPPPASQPAVAAAPPTAAEAQISELGRGRFSWPLQGPIVSEFGPRPTGQRNDGINIGCPVGAGVHAAAAGDVVYAGDQVPGFGNLVLIKHADGWVTAYGHLSRVLVKMQQKVVQGQEIGLAGATGGVSEPQLHFEIRYASTPLERAKPVDPRLVLPK